MKNMNIYKLFHDFLPIISSPEKYPFIKLFRYNNLLDLPILIHNTAFPDNDIALCAWIGEETLDVDYLVKIIPKDKILIDVSNDNDAVLKNAKTDKIKKINCSFLYEKKWGLKKLNAMI